MRSLVLIVALAACSNKANTAGEPVAVGNAQAATTTDAVYATWAGGELKQSAVEEQVAGELRTMEMEYLTNRYELLSQATSQMVDEAILEAEVKKQGVADIQALLQAEVEKKATEPTDEEVAAFYESVKAQLQGAGLEEAAPYLKQQMMQQKFADRFQVYMKELRAAAQVNTSVPYPDLPKIEVEVREHDPIRGAKDAPITIVQFAEYQCYFCNKAAPTLDELLANYEGKVRLVYKDYPLPNHPEARPAAIAAHCAGEQGKYWEMSDKLLANQQQLGRESYEAWGADLELDAKSFVECLDSNRFDAGIAQDMADAEQAGVQATPTFLVNGVLVSGAQPYERFAAVIDRALSEL